LDSPDELWHQALALPQTSFDPQFRRIVSLVFENGMTKLEVRDAETGRRLCKLDGHEADIWGIACSPDGLLYSWDVEGNIRAWNIDDGRMQWTLSLRECASSMVEPIQAASSLAQVPNNRLANRRRPVLRFGDR
jgi:WD40 repeat protein